MVLTRYLAKSVYGMLAAISALLLAVLLTNRFARFLADALSGAVSGEAIATLLVLRFPAYFGQILPLALFLSFLLVFARLARDNELTVLYAAGMGPRRLAGMVLRIALPVVLLVAFLVLVLSPLAMHRAYELEAQEAASTDLRALAAGRFTELAGGRGVLYVEEVEGERLRNVFVARTTTGRAGEAGELGVLSAAGARLVPEAETGDRFAVMEGGARYEGVPGQADFRIVEFGEYGVRVRERAQAPRLKRDSRPTAELLLSADPADRAELHWRVAMLVSVPLLALLAIPLGRAPPRGGRVLGLLPGVLAYIVYVNLLSVARVWVEQERVGAALGLWWVHALLLLAVLALLPGPLGWARLRRRAPSPGDRP